LGCGADDLNRVDPGFDPGPSPAGSCNFASDSSCNEYAHSSAESTTAASCASSGGEWSSGLCPREDRSAQCTVGSAGATRSYSYGAPPAVALQSSCPQANFVMFEVEPEEPTPTPTMDAGPAPEQDAGEDEDSGT
jgi:hypothetical protein